uniref:hypothetical protein n=1 Tax=Streptomyces tubercidicus TaxID=47759 RepID=UPI0037DC56A3|nr:hypothetical protein OG690_38335 [Streptomyces tubercidicus]
MTQHTPATSAQVNYVMKLIAELDDSDFGLEFYQGPTDREAVAAYSKLEASTLIQTLKDLFDGPC